MHQPGNDTTDPDEPSGDKATPKPRSYYYDDATGYEVYDPDKADEEDLLEEESKLRNKFESQPHLIGELIEVRPLRPEDWDHLFAVASDPLIWEQHPASDRYKEDVFREFFREALESGGALTVIDRDTGKIIGSSRYFGFDPSKSEIEIGWTFLARSYWGGKYNGQLKRLMLDHAFKYVASVVFLIGPANFRSRKAVEKIGGVLIGRRDKTDPDGNVVEQVVYQVKILQPLI